MRRLVALSVVLILVLLLSACGLFGPRQVKLQEQDAGRTVELRRGDRLQVTLDGNPTTGFQWEVAPEGIAILQEVGDPAFKPDTTALGSGGKVTLTFEATTAGQATLKLIYHRPFEEGVAPAKTFEVTVVVK